MLTGCKLSILVTIWMRAVVVLFFLLLIRAGATAAACSSVARQWKAYAAGWKKNWKRRTHNSPRTIRIFHRSSILLPIFDSVANNVIPLSHHTPHRPALHFTVIVLILVVVVSIVVAPWIDWKCKYVQILIKNDALHFIFTSTASHCCCYCLDAIHYAAQSTHGFPLFMVSIQMQSFLLLQTPRLFFSFQTQSTDYNNKNSK